MAFSGDVTHVMDVQSRSRFCARAFQLTSLMSSGKQQEQETFHVTASAHHAETVWQKYPQLQNTECKSWTFARYANSYGLTTMSMQLCLPFQWLPRGKRHFRRIQERSWRCLRLRPYDPKLNVTIGEHKPRMPGGTGLSVS